MNDLKWMSVREAIASPYYHHARYRKHGVMVYHHDKTSPTGFIGVAAGKLEEVDAICKEYGKASPISPTEQP